MNNYSIKDFISILRCPRCYSKIEITNKYLFCINRECRSNFTIHYTFDNLPILIDEHRETLFVNEFSTISSPVRRNGSTNSLEKVVRKILFGSGIRTRNNLKIVEEYLSKIKEPKVLIVGGGTIGWGMEEFYKIFYNNIIAFDIYDSPNIQFISDAHNIPVQSKSVDAVIIQAVLEHVINPELVVSEIYRVLKDNGIVYSETPFLQAIHEGPFDFTRYTPTGHQYLFKSFQCLKSGFVGGVGTSMTWSIEYFYRAIFRSRLIGKMFKIIFFWIRYVDYIVPAEHNFDAANGCYFIGVKSPKSKQLINPIDDYKGAQ